MGSERIPSRLVVESILENISKSGKGISQDNSNLPISIQIQPKCMDIYKESCLEKKEDLSAAFLLTLSFFEVNILRTKNSLIKQTNKGRKHDT